MFVFWNRSSARWLYLPRLAEVVDVRPRLMLLDGHVVLVLHVADPEATNRYDPFFRNDAEHWVAERRVDAPLSLVLGLRRRRHVFELTLRHILVVPHLVWVQHRPLHE